MAISTKMLAFAQRASWIRKMFEEGGRLKAIHGAENVYDFSLGNPDLPPPPEFSNTLLHAAGESGPGRHSYMANAGYPDVRNALARQLCSEQGAEICGEEVIMTCGAAGGLNVVLKALLDPEDEVIILAPFFVEYHFYIDNHGGVTKVVPTAEDFSLDLQAISAAINPKTKAIIINSPNNPTGQIYSENSLVELNTVLSDAGRKYGRPIYLIADEPYRKITFDCVVPGVMKAVANSIVVSSYSKDLSLPGERIGYIAVHPKIEPKEDLLGAMTLANRILGFVNAPALMQRVVGQLQGITVDTSIYTKRREKFCTILRQCGYQFVPPKGAFYIFPKSPLADDTEFVAFLQQENILAVPGRGFGMPGYFRLAFCVEDKVIEGAAHGFQKAMDKCKNFRA